MQICWANERNFDQAEVVILGIPDEAKSHALRKGTSEAPDKIREISSIRDTYRRGQEVSLGLPFDNISRRVHDFGNIQRAMIPQVLDRVISNSKIPISIGGDHSLTIDIIKAIAKKKGPLSLVYFDAHPDFVSSVQGYYGSVIQDVLEQIDISTSLQVGIRTPESEEIENIKKHNLQVITPFDIAKKGVEKIEEMILEKLGKNVYISIDMDVVDPAFAPGVSVPVPLGLSSLDLTMLLKSVVKRGVVGIDLMEVCPNYDIKDRTSHLASRMIAEILSSI